MESCSIVAYDLNSNAADNLKSNTEPVLTDADIALNGEEDENTLFLNPFMTSDYARGNAESTASNNDADLFEDDHVKDRSDIIGAEKAKIGTLTTAQLSHHNYDWSNGELTDVATPDAYGVVRYECTNVCADYTDHTGEHENSFDCAGTYVYAPAVGLAFDANAGTDTVTNMPENQTSIAYGGNGRTPANPERESGSSDWYWEFTGWYLDPECTTPFNFSTGLTDNWTVVYAGWEREEDQPPYIPDPDPSEPEEPSEPSDPGEEISDPETPQTSFPSTDPSVPDAVPGEPSGEPSETPAETIPDEETPQTAQPPQTGVKVAGSLLLVACASAVAAATLRKKKK